MPLSRKIDEPGRFKGPVGPLQNRCPLCPTASLQLLRCSGCRAFHYCSREHQVAHRPQHKVACNKVKKARAELAKEEHKVRHATPDSETPANAFETDVGRFGELHNTREYLSLLYDLVTPLTVVGGLAGIHEAYTQCRELLKLSRLDHMGIREVVPAMMLRLDLDQECYDFVKWWATVEDTYDWADMSAPYIDLRGADFLESQSFLLSPRFLLNPRPPLNQLVAILLLKLKVLVDILNLKIIRKILVRRYLPYELWDMIERDVIRSPLSAKLQRQSPKSLYRTEKILTKHIRELGTALGDANEYYMVRLFDPDKALSYIPTFYSRGSPQETALAIRYSYAAWWETEGVLNLLKDARTCAAQFLETGQVANRIWVCIDYAAENATYLGPWSERPSERYFKKH